MEQQDITLVCPIADVKENTLNQFTVSDVPLLVVKNNDNFYALNATCPHKGGTLSQGILKDNCVECPLHHATFDLTSGKMIKGPVITKIGLLDNLIKTTLPKLQVYETLVKDEQLYIKGPVIKQKTMA